MHTLSSFTPCFNTTIPCDSPFRHQVAANTSTVTKDLSPRWSFVRIGELSSCRFPKNKSHRENGGTLGMVPLIINPIYTLYSRYLLGIPLFVELSTGFSCFFFGFCRLKPLLGKSKSKYIQHSHVHHVHSLYRSIPSITSTKIIILGWRQSPGISSKLHLQEIHQGFKSRALFLLRFYAIRKSWAMQPSFSTIDNPS